MNLSKFHWDARNKLALTYLAIIMVLSIGFSAVFYHESTKAAGFGFRHQTNQLRSNIYFAKPGVIERIRNEGFDNFRQSELEHLFVLNVGMLISGGFVSYYLAKRSLEPLEEAMDAQSRFTSDAAHELRTPLTAMKTEIEVGIRDKKLTAQDARQLLGSNLEEIAKLETLTAALLRLAKNAHDPDTKAWKPIRITEVLEAARLRVEAAAQVAKINFILPPASKATIKADYDQLVELFVILFDNALKYGTADTTVTVTALQNDARVVIAVADYGIGIAAADLPHIFERFYRADQSRTKLKTSGYGLGLSVAEAIVSSHNGAITAISKPGSGTTFTVTLPRS